MPERAVNRSHTGRAIPQWFIDNLFPLVPLMVVQRWVAMKFKIQLIGYNMKAHRDNGNE
jgi:hypothetical protein